MIPTQLNHSCVSNDASLRQARDNTLISEDKAKLLFALAWYTFELWPVMTDICYSREFR